MTGWEGMLDEVWMEALGWTLIHSLWQGVLVALGLMAALRLTPRRYANARYGMAGFALFLALVLPVLTFIHLKPEAGAAAAGGAVVSDGLQLVQAASAAGSWIEQIFPWVTHAWMLGVLLLSVKMGFEYQQVRQLVRRGVRPVPEALQRQCQALAEALGVHRAWRLLESVEVDVPMVIGWMKPVILLPAAVLTGLKPEQLDMILAHELAHVRRHDYLVNLIQTAAEILLFYHPAVWWISRQMRHEREHCCDDIAVALCCDPIGYARTLADTAELRHSHLPLAMAASGGDLKLRVTRLFAHHACHPHWGSRSLVAVCLMALTVGTGIAARVQAMVSPDFDPLSIPVVRQAVVEPVLTRATASPELSLPSPALPALALVAPGPARQASAPALEPVARQLREARASVPAPAESKPVARPLVAEPVKSAPAPVQVASLAKVPAASLQDVRAAVPRATPAPEYPTVARRAGWEAEVSVRFTIGADGRISGIEFADADLHPSFRKAVTSALRQWRYTPRQEGGQKVSETHTRVFSFSLDDDGQCHTVTGSRICR